ncbi:MAG: metallophosphoesterase, partial [Deltaproteobacteria bacterium]|nr:metallophosphoesterase [Deltaproteobacteria bacterium]
MVTPLRAGCLLGIALAGAMLPGTAHAIDPLGARYLDDADELFWFVQITDSHVGEDLLGGTQDTDNLGWVLGEAAETIQPTFVVLTGDIVDATDGGAVPYQQYQAEWDEYRGVVDGLGVDATFLHDVCGNHDTYRDEGATYYLANSLLGATHGRLHEAWTHDTGVGEYLFVGLNSADTSGPFPGFDHPGLDAAELTFLEDTLVAYQDARLAFVFTHHPLHELDQGASEFMGLLADHRVSVWANGHDHDHRVEIHGNTLHFNLDSLGKADENNLGLFAVDHDGVSARGLDIDDWPYVL